MESIDILTGQHVTIKYEPASLIARMGALLLDYFFMVAYSLALSFTLFNFLSSPFNQLSESLQITIYVVGILPVMTYHLLFESLLGGRTLGKMIVRISVVNTDGSPPGIGSYFLRWVLMPVDMFPSGGIGALFIAFSPRHQRLGDLAAGTVVVKNRSASIMDLDETYYEFADDYEPTYKEVVQLTDGQIAFIVRLLTIKNRESAAESIHALAVKVKNILKVESYKDDRVFLEKIVRDYNYFAVLEV